MNSATESTGTIAADEPLTKTDTTIDFPAANNACAACKFQRRKCSTDCPLAPYFPANRLEDFQNVRRLFGVKNVLKTLADLDPSERFAAAECMIFEANCRANDPSGGCYRVIASLQREIMLLEAQRQRVLLLLRIYRPVAVAESIGGDPTGKANLCSSDLVDLSGLESDFDDGLMVDGVERLIKKENVVVNFDFDFDFDLQDRN